MTKYKILIETVTFGYELADRQKTYGTGVSHQLIEFDSQPEAEVACRAIPIAGMGGLYMRAVFRLY